MAFVKALNGSELVAGQGKRVLIGDKKIAIFRLDGKLHAIDDTCTHDEASLAEGTLLHENGKCIVECPWHGAHFDLCSGAAVTFPAVTPVKVYATRENEGAIEVEIV